jgi:hypothetical protein
MLEETNGTDVLRLGRERKSNGDHVDTHHTHGCLYVTHNGDNNNKEMPIEPFSPSQPLQEQKHSHSLLEREIRITFIHPSFRESVAAEQTIVLSRFANYTKQQQ